MGGIQVDLKLCTGIGIRAEYRCAASTGPIGTPVRGRCYSAPA